MSVQEVKGTLAKLLATEDLIIEHRQVSTASFDVHRRLLTLPVWNRASETVYDLLVSHEVGHALFTPDEDVEGVPMGFVNITEDARIEKLIKRKYPGLPKTFYRGYSELSDQDFFNVADEDIDSMNLADRVNLYFKIGSFLKVSFTPEEQVLVDQTAAAETFEEAIEAAKAIFLFMKSPETQQEKVANSSSGEDTQDTDVDDGEESEEGELREDADLNTPSYQQDSDDMSGDFDQPDAKSGFEDQIEEELKTQNSFDENISDLSSPHAQQNNYVSRPKLNLHRIITSNKHIHDRIGEWWEQIGTDTCFDHIDSYYNSFKKSAQKEVNYLVKEFEMKKSANQYSRSSIARTGVLDTSKLHTYKYQDDLFKRVTITPDGKNHGLVFVLDWSGSMHDQMMATLKQLFNLVWFCKKVSIPFEVYAFTNEWQARHFDRVSETWNALPTKHFPEQEGYLNISENFSMMNILSSTTKTKEFDSHIKNMFRIGKAIAVYNTYYNTAFTLPPRASLSGTPLNEAIASLHSIIPDFMSRNKIEKMHTVILTDGEACNSTRLVKVKRRYGDQEEYMGTRSIHNNSILRCRKSGTTYPIPMEFWNVTGVFLKNLADCFPGMNLIGFRILPNREFRNWVRRMQKPDSAEAMKVWNKNKSISFSDVCGYAEMIGINSNALEVSKEFDPVENATKAQILASFKKSYGGKKTNKKILSKFVSVIA